MTISVKDVSKLSSRVEGPRFIYAPLNTLDKPIATVVYTYDGNEVARLDLYPKNKVNVVKKESFVKKLLKSIF